MKAVTTVPFYHIPAVRLNCVISFTCSVLLYYHLFHDDAGHQLPLVPNALGANSLIHIGDITSDVIDNIEDEAESYLNSDQCGQNFDESYDLANNVLNNSDSSHPLAGSQNVVISHNPGPSQPPAASKGFTRIHANTSIVGNLNVPHADPNRCTNDQSIVYAKKSSPGNIFAVLLCLFILTCPNFQLQNRNHFLRKN